MPIGQLQISRCVVDEDKESLVEPNGAAPIETKLASGSKTEGEINRTLDGRRNKTKAGNRKRKTRKKPKNRPAIAFILISISSRLTVYIPFN